MKADDAKKRLKKPVARRIGMGVGVLFAGVAVVFAGELLAAQLSRAILVSLQLSDTQTTVFSYLLTQVIVIGLLVGLVRLMKVNAATLGLGRVANWNYLLLLPLVYLLCLVASIAVTAAASLLFSGFDVTQAQELGLAQPPNQLDLILLGIMLVVLVPLAEEFIFRGYLFGMLRREFPFWLAAVVTSVIFGVAHGQWNVGLDTFILSLALCFLREKTGSIWTGVALHALKNLVAFLLLFVYNVL